MPEFTVGAGFARGLAGFAAAKGADEAVLLARAGIDRLALLDQDARLPFSSYVALMRAGQALTGDPALGLHFGERVGIAEVSIIGLLGQASENMLEAFAQLNRYVRLIVETDNGGDADRFRFAMERGGLWMVDNRRGAETFPELTESAFAQLDDAKLADEITMTFNGNTRNATRVTMVLGHVIDMADHYSQLSNYMRLNNILPPTALPRPRPGGD